MPISVTQKPLRPGRSERYPELKRRAKEKKTTILFIDESGVRSDSVLGRTWGPRGKRTVLETSGARQSINAISAVSETGAFWYDVYEGGMNATRFVEMVEKAHARASIYPVFRF